MSLDGFFAGPNGEIDWVVWDDETADYSRALLKSVGMIVFGRVTYEMMAQYWPTARPPAEDPVIIDAMNSLPKIVFSRTLDKVEWENSILVKGDLAEEILRLKQQPGKDIVIYGSGKLVSTLTRLDLIDEFLLFVNPVVLGGGKPLFTDLKERINLKLVKMQPFKCGNVLLHYQPIIKPS